MEDTWTRVERKWSNWTGVWEMESSGLVVDGEDEGQESCSSEELGEGTFRSGTQGTVEGNLVGRKRARVYFRTC